MTVSVPHPSAVSLRVSLPWALCLVLAALLGLTLYAGARDRAELRADQARLAAQAQADLGYWRMRAGACEAQAARRAAAAAAAKAPAPANREALAQRLVAQPPAGIDGCARMESADQAVLSTLK